MGQKMKRILRFLWPPAFWLMAWFVAARLVGQELLLPSPAAVLGRMDMVFTAPFWQSVAMTLLRTGAAYVLGVALAAVLALACHACGAIDDVVRPALAVVRATPVASFIILALVWLSASNVPVLAGVLMVTPVVFANLREGIDARDPRLLEMASMFGWGKSKTFRRITVPAVLPTFVAACEACVGLCFKATIAAEVIGVPKQAVGSRLYTAKIYLETDALMAWTLTVILLSMALEKLLRLAFERGLRRGHHT